LRPQKISGRQIMVDIEKTLLPWVGKSMKVIDYFFTDRFSQKGIELTKVQWILLKRLKQRNGISQHDLAFLTNRDKASLARLITTMENKNLVARIPSDADQRINQIYITSHGEKILKQAMPEVERMIAEMQKGMSNEEKKTTIRVLQKLMNNIKSKELVALETN